MGMWRGFLHWVVHGDRPEPTEREKLIQAQEKLKRQIEILEDGPILSRDTTARTPELIADLREALDAVEAEIAEKPDGSG